MKKPISLMCILTGLAFFTLITPGIASSRTPRPLIPEGLVIVETYSPGKGAPVAVVQTIEGQAVILHADATRGYRASKGLALYQGDTVVTLERGGMGIRFNDRSLLMLASETRLTIDRGVYDPALRIRSSFLSMAFGKIRCLVAKMVHFRQADFRVTTPTAIAGVRGSDFVILATASFTRITTFRDTRLEVSSIIAPDQRVLMTDFQTTRIDENALPAPVEPVSPESMDRAVNGLPGFGSSINGMIFNRSAAENAANTAAGTNSRAGMGTVRIHNSRVSGSIVNESGVKNSVNAAVGTSAEAHMGAIVVE